MCTEGGTDEWSIYSKTYMYFKNISRILMTWNLLISSDRFWFMIFPPCADLIPLQFDLCAFFFKNETSMVCREIQTMTTSFLTVNLYI